MSQPLINILIRVSRPEMFDRCIESVHLQTYSNIRIIIHQDIEPRERKPYDWNLFCNILKSQVTSGYFLFLDDDDTLRDPFVIEQLARHLQDDPDGLICQFLRNGKPKPNDHLIATKQIRKGLIGGGCLVLAARYAGVADWEAKEAADYDWIAAVALKVKLKFVPLVVQVAGNNGLHGKQTLQATEERYE
jgi:hypothetical protein